MNSEKFSDLTQNAQAAVGDVATKAKHKAQAFAQAAADTVDDHRVAAARVMSDTASAIDDRADLPGEAVTRFAEEAADELDATADYVRKNTAGEMIADFKRFVIRNPGASLVGAAIVGALVGRGFRKG